MLQPREHIREPEGNWIAPVEVCNLPLAQHGTKQGCDRSFDDPRYHQLDHGAPVLKGSWSRHRRESLRTSLDRLRIASPNASQCDRISTPVWQCPDARKCNLSSRRRFQQFKAEPGPPPVSALLRSSPAAPGRHA